MEVIIRKSPIIILPLIIHRVTLERRGLLERKDTWQVLFPLSNFHLFKHNICFSIPGRIQVPASS